MPMIVKAFAYDACHVPKPLIYNCDINEKIGRKPAGSHAASTVMNTWNGRYEMTFCRLSPDFLNVFAFSSPSFCSMITWLLPFRQYCFGKKRGGVGRVVKNATSCRSHSVWACCAEQNSGWCPWRHCLKQTCCSECR